mgnify:CR=1 FL=1
MRDAVISTDRLEVHYVLPSEYQQLMANPSDPALWVNRGFANPYGYFVHEPGPLRFRYPLVLADPSKAPYLLRVAVLRDAAEIIGGAGFHDAPDEAGMIEIGFTILEPFRRQGFGLELLHGMWRWVIEQPNVRTLRYTVSPDNSASQHIIRMLGFTHVGVQIDEEDGPEDIFEMSASEYRHRFADRSRA